MYVAQFVDFKNGPGERQFAAGRLEKKAYILYSPFCRDKSTK